MADVYEDREQTQAKHFILRRYLQALAFKILRICDLTYVDGFSGPWKTKSEDFSDSSFKIAITLLKDAQQRITEETGRRPRVRCFFSEVEPAAFAQLHAAVVPFHQPEQGFEVKTYQGMFEHAVPEIRSFVGRSFALIFIDPTGWAGYPFDKLKSLFAPRMCEVLINFMYSFISRFVDAEDEGIVESLNPILGGPGWRSRLDPTLPRGEAVLKLFRASLKAAGEFEYVVATKIDKATEDRPHFFMAYGTKAYKGLTTFRDVEYLALRVHAANRAMAKGRKSEAKTGIQDMFTAHDAVVREASIDDDVAMEVMRAKALALTMLRDGPRKFSKLAGSLMENFMLRETNVKGLLVELSREGELQNIWRGNSKPQQDEIIRLKA